MCYPAVTPKLTCSAVPAMVCGLDERSCYPNESGNRSEVADAKDNDDDEEAGLTKTDGKRVDYFDNRLPGFCVEYPAGRRASRCSTAPGDDCAG